jgi:NitT/TauT family transport system substrate-binding protein
VVTVALAGLTGCGNNATASGGPVALRLGYFPATAHPDVVRRLVAGQVAANGLVNTRPEEAQRVISAHIGTITGKPLDPALIQKAWPNLTFLNDPLAASLRTGLDHAVAVGLTKPVDLTGLHDLSHLNQVLAAQGSPEVPQP